MLVIRAPRTPRLRSFPHPHDFHDVLPLDDPGIFAQAPWFFELALLDRDLLEQYIHDDVLVDGLPESDLGSDDWLRHCAVPDSSIARYGGESFTEACAALTKLVHQNIRRLTGAFLIPIGWGLDT